MRQHIGPYRILGVLGEGGMGMVYLAEQRLPVHRRVAIKVIKLGLDSKAVLARFDAERQALAMMEHSCIAKMYEAGLDEGGQPYFVMEYIRGEPITAYCDEHQLTIRERIVLFQRVCSAVQHAHLKGVMHRDLKPSNILVTLQDGSAHPKIIDFGLAKAMNQRLSDAALFTEHGYALGTPGYMSPEQAAADGLDVDSRTDVYSLGVILYELLVGVPPLPREALRVAGPAEMQRLIREFQPARPSARLAMSDPLAHSAAATRRANGRELRRTLSGDLDWIVMQAIEKDRGRRYQTASELAADLERYLVCVPVLAGPPSVRYRVQRFLRRHRSAVAAVGAAAIGLMGFSAVAYLQWDRAERNARDAEARAVDARRRVAEIDMLREVVAVEEFWRERTATAVVGLDTAQSRNLLVELGERRARIAASMAALGSDVGAPESEGGVWTRGYVRGQLQKCILRMDEIASQVADAGIKITHHEMGDFEDLPMKPGNGFSLEVQLPPKLRGRWSCDLETGLVAAGWVRATTVDDAVLRIHVSTLGWKSIPVAKAEPSPDSAPAQVAGGLLGDATPSGFTTNASAAGAVQWLPGSFQAVRIQVVCKVARRLAIQGVSIRSIVTEGDSGKQESKFESTTDWLQRSAMFEVSARGFGLNFERLDEILAADGCGDAPRVVVQGAGAPW